MGQLYVNVTHTITLVNKQINCFVVYKFLLIANNNKTTQYNTTSGRINLM